MVVDDYAVRCKVFVAQLAWGTTDDSLRSFFESFGRVVDAKVGRMCHCLPEIIIL